MNVPTELQQLCLAVPWPPDEARALPASAAQIEAAERALKIRLPEQLRSFLMFLNGPCIGPGGIYGVETARRNLDLVAISHLHPSWQAQGWIPVAGDGCGNDYVLVTGSLGEPPVGFVDTIASPDEIAYVVASNYWHFLRFLLLKELGVSRWPFAREEVLREDPRLACITLAPLPWEA